MKNDSLPAAAAASAVPAVGNFRWVICALLFFSVAVNYVDRNIIGILKMPLSKELGWGETDYAHIASVFQLAYAFGYLFGGRFMDWFGVKRGLPLAVLLWSFAAAAHGLCIYIPAGETIRLSLPWFFGAAKTLTWVLPMTAFGFMAARVTLGLAEGGNFPASIKTVAEWFPVKERALATGLFNAGTNVGAILCPIGVLWMFSRWGWPMTFYVTGALGFAWVVAWWLLYDNPEKHRHLSAAERDFIRSGQPLVEEKKAAVPWFSLLGYRAVWAYMIASILAGPVWTIYMFFLPDFLDKRYHIPLKQIGWWTALFYFIAAFGGVAGGWLAGKLIGRGWSINAARKVSLLLCAVAVVPVFLAPHVSSVWLTVIIVGIAGSAHQGWSANLFSFVSDTMPKRTISSVVGLGGFVSYLTGALIAELIGWVLQTTGSYVTVFAGASLMYVISLALLHLLVPKIGPVAATTVPAA
jgi:ACS family hexuronate transporter-like MFS transporter